MISSFIIYISNSFRILTIQIKNISISSAKTQEKNLNLCNFKIKVLNVGQLVLVILLEK